jgi:hypothetical protein
LGRRCGAATVPTIIIINALVADQGAGYVTAIPHASAFRLRAAVCACACVGGGNSRCAQRQQSPLRATTKKVGDQCAFQVSWLPPHTRFRRAYACVCVPMAVTQPTRTRSHHRYYRKRSQQTPSSLMDYCSPGCDRHGFT